MTFLTGFAKSNNLIENELDRLAIQNLLPNLQGIADDVALLVNNIRNESSLEIKNTEIAGSIITIVNTIDEFKTRSNVFTNKDLVDVYHLGVKQNVDKLTVIDSNAVDRFSLSTDGVTPMDLTTLKDLGGVLTVIRNDAVFLDNFTYVGISDIDYVDVNTIVLGNIFTFETVQEPAETLSTLLSDIDFTIRSREIKYRTDGSLTLEQELVAEGSFIASGDVSSAGDTPGLYITDATSPVDNIVAVRAFSNDNNPWTQNGGDLETEASAVTIGNLVFNQKIEINGLNVSTEFGAISDVFTHKLPIKIDGQTYFICLNKPT